MLSYEVANFQGMGTRARQEDSFCIANSLDEAAQMESGLFLVLADGMGGLEDGKMASETAVSFLKSRFEAMDPGRNITKQLVNGIRDANKLVLEALGGCGETIVICIVIHDGRLHFASVGDSFLFIKRTGCLARINRLHNRSSQICMETVLEGKLGLERDALPMGGGGLTQFVGSACLDEIDFFSRPLRLEEDDILLLCSDGIGASLSHEDIGRCLDGGDEPAEMCSSLEMRLIEKGLPKQDNYTGLAVKCVKRRG